MRLSPPAAPSTAHHTPPSKHRHVPPTRWALWGLVAWMALEGWMHGWAAGVQGDMPDLMSAGFSLGRSVLAYAWWRADRQRAATRGRLWLSGLVIVQPWLGCAVHLILNRPGAARRRAVWRYGLFLLALALSYVLSGSAMSYLLGGL